MKELVEKIKKKKTQLIILIAVLFFSSLAIASRAMTTHGDVYNREYFFSHCVGTEENKNWCNKFAIKYFTPHCARHENNFDWCNRFGAEYYNPRCADGLKTKKEDFDFCAKYWSEWTKSSHYEL
jgi:hypothetical protein